MQPKVSLQARVNDGTGQFPQIPADIRRRAILIPIQRKKGRSLLSPERHHRFLCPIP